MSNRKIETKQFSHFALANILMGSEPQDVQACCDLINFVAGSDKACIENYHVAAPIAALLIVDNLIIWGMRDYLAAGVNANLRENYENALFVAVKNPHHNVKELMKGLGVDFASDIAVTLPQFYYGDLNYPTKNTFELLLTKSLVDDRLYLPLDARAGSRIQSTIEQAQKVQLEYHKMFKRPVTVEFGFNGTLVHVHQFSDLDLIYRDWSRSMSGYIDGIVGPMPAKKLTAEELASDAKIKAENEKRATKRNAEYAAKHKEETDALMSRLDKAPAMEFSNEQGWKDSVAKNQDSYGGGVMTFAERWARLMQYEVDVEGKKVADIASELSSEADVEGITGFMYGCAVSILAQTWKHGEELRIWHNKDTQLGDEGDKANESGAVLNPALLSVGT